MHCLELLEDTSNEIFAPFVPSLKAYTCPHCDKKGNIFVKVERIPTTAQPYEENDKKELTIERPCPHCKVGIIWKE